MYLIYSPNKGQGAVKKSSHSTQASSPNTSSPNTSSQGAAVTAKSSHDQSTVPRHASSSSLPQASSGSPSHPPQATTGNGWQSLRDAVSNPMMLPKEGTFAGLKGVVTSVMGLGTAGGNQGHDGSGSSKKGPPGQPEPEKPLFVQGSSGGSGRIRNENVLPWSSNPTPSHPGWNNPPQH